MILKNHSVENQLERSRLAIKWGGILGASCHPFYYFVWTYLVPQPYDNLWLRLSAALLCIPLILQDRWKKSASKFLLVYWYFCLIYVLPFVCTYLAIRNDFSTMWMMTEVMMMFILALCIDMPLLLLGCVITGMLLGTIAAVLTSPYPITLYANDRANLALLPVVMLCSMAFSYAINKGRGYVERSRALQALAGSIAHEMRNPLGQIKYSLDSIGHMLPPPSTTNKEQSVASGQLRTLYLHLSHGQTAIERGLQVISMILEEVKLKPVDPSSFTYLHAARTVQKAVEEYSFETEGERHKISIDVRKDFLFKGDETILIFVLFNLIKNALYYLKSHPTAKITLTIDTDAIRVRDTGPGIPKSVLPQLFESFHTSGKTGGTGLGLSYCKRAMKAFGGDILCESSVGEYTEFVLRFPVIDEAEFKAHEAALLEAAKPVFHEKRILIVDDEPLLRRASRDVLSRVGAEIHEAENGQVALEHLRAGHFDLVLMDLNMPVLDGYAAAERIRTSKDPRYQHVPIIAYTTESAYMATVKTQKVGMNGFIEKPCRPAELILSLQEALEAAPPQASPQNTSALEGKRVLLVDDEPLNLSIITADLKRFEVETVTANHGQAALDAISSGLKIDAVLLDLNMPGMNGIEVARAIRAMPNTMQNLPIIALTGYSDESKMQDAVAAGINVCLTKPVDATQLAQNLTQVFASEAVVTTSAQLNEALPVEPSQEPASKDISLVEGIELFDLEKLTELVNYNGIDEVLLLRDRIVELLADIESGNANQDIERIQNSMHSLISMAGHAGARALIELTRQHYLPMQTGEWPAEMAWAEQIREVGARTVETMTQYWEHGAQDFT